MTALTFTVMGKPAPQGSKRHVGHGILIESSKRVLPWRSAVVNAACDAIAAAPVDVWPLDGPVEVMVTFWFTAPKSAPKRRYTWPVTRSTGDLDKLARALLDGLTDAGVFRDDAQVVALRAVKRHSHDAVPKAIVSVLPVGDDES